MNSSIAGPAGSGKTESVKELAKLLGLFCVVLNCSEAVDLYVLDKVFAGKESSLSRTPLLYVSLLLISHKRRIRSTQRSCCMYVNDRASPSRWPSSKICCLGPRR